MNHAQRYDTLAGNYDARWRHYNRAVYDEVFRHVSHDLSGSRVLDSRVLDVGCGTGAWLELLMRRNPQIARVVGVEPSREMLNVARARFGPVSTETQLEWIRKSAAEIALKAHSFDLVTCLNTLHYLENAPQFFADAHRVLEPDGTLIVQDYTRNGVPFFNFAARLFDGGCRHVYSARELNQLAQNAGFRVKYARSFRITGFWRGIVLVATKK